MPIYCFWCSTCDSREERILSIEHRDKGPACCSTPMLRVWTTPNLDIWNQERRFPNINKSTDDGSLAFDSKFEYELHLKENHLVEVSQGGLVQRPHGNRVVYTDGRATGCQPTRRTRPGPIRGHSTRTRRSNAKLKRGDRVERG